MTLSARKGRPQFITQLAIVASAAIGYSSTTLGGQFIAGEAVDDYTTNGCDPNDLTQNINNVNGFLTGMSPGAGVSWPVLVNWTDGNVWDTDFVDNDVPGVNGNGGDEFAFDYGGNPVAMAMFSGHGVGFDVDTACDPIGGTTAHCCSTSADCTTPVTSLGQTLPGICTRGPGWTGRTGFCVYKKPRALVTCSTNDHFAHRPQITLISRFGESANSGAWAGAGTNGGINFAILDMSIAVRPGQELNEVGPIFAGLHNYATVMPIAGSDINDYGMRGSGFAHFWQMNPNSSAAFFWAFSETFADPMDGGHCSPFGSPGFSTDGFHGIVGCGAYWSASLAANSTQAQFLNQQETFVQTQNDGNDATGAGWIAWTLFCNYDCNTFPMHL